MACKEGPRAGPWRNADAQAEPEIVKSASVFLLGRSTSKPKSNRLPRRYPSFAKLPAKPQNKS